MKYFKQLLMTCLLLTLANTALAAKDKKVVETIYEGEPVVIFIGKSMTGALQLKDCDECAIIKLRITEDTRAYYDNKLVPLSSKANTSEKPALVYYDKKTNTVTRLHWYSM